MSIERVELLVEEPSMEQALRELLPRLVGELSFDVYPFQCKADLLAKLPARLRGYASRCAKDSWFKDHCRIVVLVDRDDDACKKLKQKLETIASNAGLVTRTHARSGNRIVVSRIAIEELEAWYFGDWTAVRAAYPRVSDTIPAQARYRDPDAIQGGTWEAFERVLQTVEYFKGGLRKIEAARTIAARMDPWRNTSQSFRAFRDVLSELRPSSDGTTPHALP